MAGWWGAVLTGGSSRRMGTDKALLALDGSPMAMRVAAALAAAGAGEVVCVGGDDRGLRALGLDVVADRHAGEGPLGGILTALEVARGAVVLVAPCDLLAPDPRTFAAIVEGAVPPALAAVPVVGGQRQPLNAAYRGDAAPLLQAAFAAGERSVRRALATVPVIELHGLDPATLADADEPGDLPAAR